MSLPDRKENEVRRMLEGPHPALPPDLADRAAERGRRLLRRHRVLRTVGWLLLLAAAVAFGVWAAIVEPWTAPPTDTTPPLEGW
ncbi:hypothetical protein AB0B12_03650 [Streptomyces sp. NPDC044780]|uniref:Uncharacterized protein n=1 Tax=Streptomyces luomodiensis TaxID=3026192 RepID=A0ABY9V1T3_9ACTN|nr:hypothetical protein [Streptomyces sp. SCA4-21]WNE98546.1 hypothetical protein PS467_26050 [Streptomyces sp. SCA4-21]